MRTSKSLAEPWLNIHSWRSAQAHLQNWIFPNFTFVHMFNVPQRSKSHFCKSIQTQFGWNRTVKRAYQDLNVYFGAWHGKKMTILVWLQRCVPSFVQPPRIPYWWSEGCFLVRRIIFSLFLLFIFFFLVPGTRTKHVLAPCLWNHAQWNCFLFMEPFHVSSTLRLTASSAQANGPTLGIVLTTITTIQLQKLSAAARFAVEPCRMPHCTTTGMDSKHSKPCTQQLYGQL